MQYFDTLPKILQADGQGVSRVFTNIMTRVSVIPEILKNPMVYYQYTIQEGDTPEIIANKYYGDSYRYWLVLFANELLDPQWDWPMTGKVFDDYINTKYPDIQPTVDVHHHEKILTQYDSGTDTQTINRVTISEEEYNLLVETTYNKTLPTGIVSVDINKRAVTYYDYESELNDSKKIINLLNNSYVNQVELEFSELMSK
jgi:hypothetical protein